MSRTEEISPRPFLSSVTRIANLHERDFDMRALPRQDWATGDYVVGRVLGRPNPLYMLELVNALEGAGNIIRL